MREKLQMLYGEYHTLHEAAYDYFLKKIYKQKMDAIEALLKQVPYGGADPINERQNNMTFSTEIRKTFDGKPQVGFTIGVQTFYLQPVDEETKRDEKEMAKWYEKQLTHALNNLKK